MKILYVTDLHGNTSAYQKTLELAQVHNVGVVVNGGDMLPKTSGKSQEMFITDYLQSMFKEYDNRGVEYVCMLGNDDCGCLDTLFDYACIPSSIHNIAQKKVILNGYDFIGMNFVPDYPFRLKDRCRPDTPDFISEEQFGTGLYSSYHDGKYKFREILNWENHIEKLPTIADELEALPKPDDYSKAIYIIHTPPVDTPLDACANGFRAGSRAVTQFIRERRPMLTLHGHIHESPDVTGFWKCQLGYTICIQPGQTKPLTYVLINTATGKCERFIAEV